MIALIIALIYFFSLIPFPFYCGSSLYWIFGVDNGNVGFIMLVVILFPLIYWMAGIESNTMNFSLLISVLFILLLMCFLIISLLLFFIVYECFIIMLFFILFLYLPSFYSISTAFIFFLFTIFGSISFIISLMIIIIDSFFIVSILLTVPFCVNIPSFPFFYWLPEVHCECTTSMSMMLAGVVLKLGIYGILSFILSSFFLPLRFLSSFVLSLSLIGIIIASCSVYSYYDLKKMIAFSSIIHLNLSFSSIVCMNGIGILSSIFISISHAFSSSSLFMFVGIVINNTYSSYWDSFFFIDQTARFLLLFFILGNLSFALSLNFIGEIYALIGLFSIDCWWLVSYLLGNLLSTFFWFFIMNRNLPYHTCYTSLNYIELLILSWLILMNGVGGVGFPLNIHYFCDSFLLYFSNAILQ